MNMMRWIQGGVLVATATLAATALFAQGAPASPGVTKICAPFVANNWRTVTPVPETWNLNDCRTMGQMVGAVSLQVGCAFDREPPGQTSKFILGAATPIANPPTPANLPNPNCGW